MIEDRDYMRQPEYPGLRWSLTTILLVVYTVVFVLELIGARTPQELLPIGSISSDYFALSKDGLSHGYFWQLFTYQFMHGSLMHLVGNCMTLYFFGRALEELIGWKRCLTILLLSGVVGGLFQVGAAWLWPGLFGGAVIGASAGVFGVLAAYAMLEPEQEVSLFFIPIGLRVKTLLIIFAVMALMSLMFSQFIGGHIAHAAHLGGMLTGIFYVRQIMQGQWFHLANPLRRAAPRPLVKAQVARKKEWANVRETPVQDPAAQFMENEVNPILDKISTHGIHSLTDRERRILETARNNMNRS
jgi:membrane associated rhomboid family serine protease